MEDLIKQYKESVELNCRIFDEFGDEMKKLLEDFDTQLADSKHRQEDIINSTDIRLKKTGKYEFKDGVLSISDWDCLEYCLVMMFIVESLYRDYFLPAIQNKLGYWGCDIFLSSDIEELKRETSELSLSTPMLTNEECFVAFSLLGDSEQRRIISLGGKMAMATDCINALKPGSKWSLFICLMMLIIQIQLC